MRRTIAVFAILVIIAACRLPGSREQDETAETIMSMLEEPAPTVTPTDTPVPTPTPAPTTIPTEPAAEQILLEGLIGDRCPQVSFPAGFLDFREQYQDPMAADPQTYDVYQAVALLPAGEPEFCKLLIPLNRMGEFQFSDDALFWQAYDYEVEQVAIWQYDPYDQLEDEVDPVHVQLDFTSLDLPPEMNGLGSFAVSMDGSEIVWSKTEPKQDDEGNFAFLQEIYFGDIAGVNMDLLWYDAVPDEYPHIIRLRELRADTHTLYYSDEPIGLGTSYPNPVGKYSSLYSMPTWAGEMPKEHYHCGMDHWCISDYSPEHDLLAAIQEDTLRLLNMNGELLADLEPPGGANFLRQAEIGPDGSVAFLALQRDEADLFADPLQVALYYWSPPFQEAPQLVTANPKLRNILGWVSADMLATDILFSSAATGKDNEVAFINLVSIPDGAMEMSVYPTTYFVDLLR